MFGPRKASHTGSSTAPIPKRRARPPHHRLDVRVDEQGILLVPSSTAATPAARIAFNGVVSSASTWPERKDDAAPELHCAGIVGTLQLFAASYLLLIGSTEIAATLPSTANETHSIRRIRDVFAIPLSDAEAARQAIALRSIARQQSGEASDSDLTDVEPEADDDSDLHDATTSSATFEAPTKRNTGLLGLGAYLWRPVMSKKPVETSAAQPEHPPPSARAVSLADAVAEIVPPDINLSDLASKARLDAKILRAVLRELRQNQYISYDCDLTRNLQHKVHRREETEGRELLAEPDRDVPLFKRADKRFVFNAHLVKPFVAAGLDQYCLPIMQGFVSQQSVMMPLVLPPSVPKGQGKRSPAAQMTMSDEDTPLVDVTLTIISRRSQERPGLRYQRRGIDTAGHVANFVETEYLISADQDGQTHVASYVQTRGSIPLYWSQTPTALKPVPTLERSEADNLAAIKLHFDTQTKLYGPQTIINLAEQHGKEGALVDSYRQRVADLNDPDVH